MKSFKYLLALPLALTSLVACGGSSKENFTSIDYAKAGEIADSYATSISNSKAASITVSGDVNKVKVKGDITWWSYHSEKDPEKEEQTKSILEMIPNFSLKNSEINVDPQSIASFEIPGSLMSVADTMIGIMADDAMFALLDNLPKFPMNSRMLQLVHGFEFTEESFDEDQNIVWEKLGQKDWVNATDSYYTSNGRLKVVLEFKDTFDFINEVKERVMGEQEYEPSKIKLPGSIAITTNKVGYIDSFSINCSVKDVDKEFAKGSMYSLYLKGDAEIDVSLRFKQTYAKPVTIKYQLVPYHMTTAEEAEKGHIDATYLIAEDTNINLTKDPNKIIDPTTSLDAFKDYFTVDWYKNVADGKLTVKHDIPFFNLDYWYGKDSARNVAYTDDSYDVVVMPTYNDSGDAKYTILGAKMGSNESQKEIVIQPSKVYTSIDGRVISTDQGMKRDVAKSLLSAADVITSVTIEKEDAADIELLADEIFVNSTMFNDAKSECVVTIPVLDNSTLPVNSIL